MNESIVAMAAEVLGMSVDEVVTHSKPLPEIDATYFWKPTRGGSAVIIDSSGEKLVAGSAISLPVHIGAFKGGRRN